MRLMIEIPDEKYEEIKNSGEKLHHDNENRFLLNYAVLRGTPIPDDCGRLISADELKKQYPHDLDWDYPVHTSSSVVETIDNAQTIIAAIATNS